MGTPAGNLAKDTKQNAPIDASLVPVSKRVLQILCAVISCLLAGGVVFGYAAFKPVLIAEGVYRDGCTPAEIAEDVPVCHQQEMKLNMIFTVAAVATNVCALAVGTILDQYGPRVSGLIGSILLALGCVGFEISKNVTVVDLYPASYLFLGLAGPFIYISSMNLANAFPHRSGFILSLLTGAFDSSPAVFLVYRLLYQSILGPISLRTWFSAYLIVPLFIFLVQLFIMSAQSYKTFGEIVGQTEVTSPTIYGEGITHSSADEVGGTGMIGETDALLGKPSHHTEAQSKNSGISGSMNGKDVRTQLTSFWFWGIAGFTIIQMLRINYFVASIRSQYEFLLHSYEASVTINNFFDVALPVGGVLAIPFIGTFLDTFPMLTIISTLVACTTSIGILGLIQGSYRLPTSTFSSS